MDIPTQSWSVGHGLRKFKQGSTLHEYLASKKSHLINKTNSRYRLSTVLLAIKQIIEEEELYDKRNTAIIVCDKELEIALDVSSLHVSQLRQIVEEQMTMIHGYEEISDFELSKQELKAMAFWFEANNPLEIILHRAGATFQEDFNSNDKSYVVKPDFLKVIRTLPGVDKKTSMLSYRKAKQYTSNYIMANKEKFFDLRNIRICQAKGDLLSRAFKVDYFFRTQVDHLIQQQLTPLRRSQRKLKKEAGVFPNQKAINTFV